MLDRLKQWMNLEDLNLTKLSSKINVSKSSISHILSGRNKPSIDFFYKLLDVFPNLNLNWLISGRGKMYIKKENESNTVNKIIVFNENKSFQEFVPKK